MIAKLVVSIILIACSLLFGLYFSGGRLSVFFDIPTIVSVLGVSFFILMASWPLKEMGKAFRSPFQKDPSPIDLRKSLAFFKSMKAALVWAGIVAVMMGLVSMLIVIVDFSAKLDNLGKYSGVLLLSVFQAALAVVIVELPFETAARRRLAELE
jgi:flagellar motor component MotA